MLEIKRIMYIHNQEDFFGHRRLFFVSLIMLFTLMASNSNLQVRIMVHLFSLFWVSINTHYIFTLHARKNCEYIFCESGQTYQRRFIMLMNCSIIENSIFILMIFFHLIIFMHCSVLNALIIVLLHYVFAIVLGIFSSQLGIRIGIITIFLFNLFGFYYGSGWTLSAHEHLFSLSVQLYSVDKLHITNTMCLIIYTVIFFLLAEIVFARNSAFRICKIGCILIVGIFVFVGVIQYELAFNNKIEGSKFQTSKLENVEIKYRGSEENSIKEMCQIILLIEKELSKVGIKQSKVYQIDRYYVSIFGNIYKTRPIPVLKDKDKIFINIFSDAQLNRKEQDLQIDLIERVYSQIESYQMVIYPNDYLKQFVSAYECEAKKNILNEMKIENKDYEEMLERKKERIKKIPISEQNIIMKIVIYMMEDCPQTLSELYFLLENEEVTDIEVLQKEMKEYFPKFMDKRECKTLFQNIEEMGK